MDMRLRHWLSTVRAGIRDHKSPRRHLSNAFRSSRRRSQPISAAISPEALEERVMLTVETHIEPLDPYNPAVGPVTPSWISTHLLPSDESTHTVTLAFGAQGGNSTRSADIVFVVDESGSMSGEQAWLSETVTKLEAQLNAAQIDDNRFALVGYGASGSEQGRFFGTTPTDVLVTFYDDTNTAVGAPVKVPVNSKTGIAISDVTLPRSGEYRVVVQSTNSSLTFS